MRASSIARVILIAAGVAAGLYLLYLIRQLIGAVVIAVFLAVALGPAVDLVQRGRMPRALAILIVYLGLVSGVFLLGLLVVPPVVDEVNEFVEDVPGYVRDLRESETIRDYDDRYRITEQLESQARRLPERLGDAAGALQNVTVGVFSALVQLVTVLVMTFFLLLDGRRILAFGYAQMGPERERRARALASDVYRAVGGYVTGNFAISLIAGFSTYVVLTIIGVPFAVPLAVLMAFFDMIPLVGATIAGIIIAIVSSFENFPTALIVWGLFLFIYQQIENNVLQPFVYRRTVALHPLLVIIAVLIGGTLLGILGALLAIPAAATLQILAKDWYHFHRNPRAGEGADHTEETTEMGPGSPPSPEPDPAGVPGPPEGQAREPVDEADTSSDDPPAAPSPS